MKWFKALLQRIVAEFNTLFPPVPELREGLRQLTKGKKIDALWVPEESLYEGEIAPWTIREVHDCAAIGGYSVDLELLQVDGVWLVIFRDYQPITTPAMRTA